MFLTLDLHATLSYELSLTTIGGCQENNIQFTPCAYLSMPYGPSPLWVTDERDGTPWSRILFLIGPLYIWGPMKLMLFLNNSELLLSHGR